MQLVTYTTSVQRIVYHAALLAVALNFATAWGQPPVPTQDPQWNYRYEMLQLLLQQNNMNATTDLQETFGYPAGSAIIILGKADDVTRDPNLFKSYIQSGGRVLIAADSFTSPEFGTIVSGPVHAENPADEFEGFSDCVLLTRLSTTHPITNSLSTIATNVTGWIEHRGNELIWQDLARLPVRTLPFSSRGKPVCIVGTYESDEHLLNQSSPASRRRSPGGVVLLADPSVLTNGMLWHMDNGHFAARIANWLSEGERSIFTMIVDGQYHQTFSAESLMTEEERRFEQERMKDNLDLHALPEDLPKPKLDTLLQVANAAIKETANPDKMNQRLQNHPRRTSPANHALIVWSALATAIIAFVVWLLMKRATELFFTNRRSRRTTARQLLHEALPTGLRNKVAAETLAREFSRQWTGREAEPEWRRALEEIKYQTDSRLSKTDRVQVESILAIAVFGGKVAMVDSELQNLGNSIDQLLHRYRPTNPPHDSSQNYPEVKLSTS